MDTGLQFFGSLGQDEEINSLSVYKNVCKIISKSSDMFKNPVDGSETGAR